MATRILAVGIHDEQDVVAARQRSRQIAALLRFGAQDQTRIATSVSEVARNAYAYGGGGKVEFALEGDTSPQVLIVTVSDQGPGIANLRRVLDGSYRSTTGMGLGLVGARSLMDHCEIDTGAAGTTVVLKKILPPGSPALSSRGLRELARELAGMAATSSMTELSRQNRELLETLAELNERQQELLELTRELEDTNRGVVALYAELDEKADHLRRADEMKSRFLSNMSHEFRTPLSSIRALSKLLLDRVDGELTGEQEKQVHYIKKGADELWELVNDLLDLAKIEAGKTDVRPGEFEVANLFSALRGMLRPLLVTDRVELVFEVPEGLPPMVTDEGKVSQILRNFISNALKFTERGEVRVKAALSADGTAVHFTVADTGIGIDGDDLELIFEEFSQIESPLQRRIRGTGLGLPLCRKLVTLLGGSIRVESELGSGSTFHAVVPLNVQSAVPNLKLPAPDELDVPPGDVLVLIVEDDPAIALLYEKYMRGTRYRPATVGSAYEARRLLYRVTPAAIVLDILLQGEDGWRFLAEVKNSPRTQAIPCIVATKVDDERKGLVLGADAYFVKPIDRATLLAGLDRVVPGADADDPPLAENASEALATTVSTIVATTVHAAAASGHAEGGTP